MPILRYSRDKRGYEHVYLVQPTTGRKGKVRSRILYWYRTPPNVKVGRDPFDDEVRRAIEKQYPDLQFDWPKLLAAPKPAIVNTDIERWRERRRQAKAERAAAASEAQAAQGPDEAEAVETAEPGDAPADTAIEPATATAAPAQPGEARRKRRRRRRHARRPDQPAESGATVVENLQAHEPADAEPSTPHARDTEPE